MKRKKRKRKERNRGETRVNRLKESWKRNDRSRQAQCNRTMDLFPADRVALWTGGSETLPESRLGVALDSSSAQPTFHPGVDREDATREECRRGFQLVKEIGRGGTGRQSDMAV